MKNKTWSVPSDPFISHMRISYEDNIRKSTEEYWRNKIALEFFDMPEVAERIRNERS
jgi:hypothetical protein